MKTYGPYFRPDGRAHMIHYDSATDTRITQSYPRYLMEQHLGRKLLPTEHVDHINNDHTDNRIENFQLLSVAENVRKSHKIEEIIIFLCPVCGTESSKPASKVRHNRKQGKAGPFCSKKCAGVWSTNKQYNKN